ncbi:MAG: DUF3667 domain-containing protein [Lewinellaceae bacterium]|nr:DUF3667 domain-containing protein [Lewinellaceae bacterium]
MNMTVCKNCANAFEGKHCPECGQKAKTGRITFLQVFKEFRQHLIHFETGFLFTMKELMLRPGYTIREYLEGKRVKHIKPLKFALWATAISFVVLHFLGNDKLLLENIEHNGPNSIKSQAIVQKLSAWIFNNPSILQLFIIPTIAFSSWLFFRKKGYNYAEHIVISAYLLGELSLYSMFTAPFAKWYAQQPTTLFLLSILNFGVWFAYFGWAYAQIFQPGKKLGIWIKGGLTIFLGYVLLLLAMSLIIPVMLTFFKPQIEQWLSL